MPTFTRGATEIYYEVHGSGQRAAGTAPHAELVQSWKTGPDAERAIARMHAFLSEYGGSLSPSPRARLKP
ncbi:MAG: hypothetical protein ABI488_15700 [Polyangiaceae bacterium]